MSVTSLDFESSAYTDFATPAVVGGDIIVGEGGGRQPAGGEEESCLPGPVRRCTMLVDHEAVRKFSEVLPLVVSNANNPLGAEGMRCLPHAKPSF
jgi:hypothetical protein